MIVAVANEVTNPREVVIITFLLNLKITDLYTTYGVRRNIKGQFTRNAFEVVSRMSFNTWQTKGSIQNNIF
jgi:hypothetical protein